MKAVDMYINKKVRVRLEKQITVIWLGTKV
jgi:hypothetical protein